ncbi:hypothetical protein R1flu_007179 [Riccia fluitans]|uniref:Uncharacterized protein n=1 Tax=Riccia fluitans TaxID=41844 RepID=A0ABD1YYD4_9MARC
MMLPMKESVIAVLIRKDKGSAYFRIGRKPYSLCTLLNLKGQAKQPFLFDQSTDQVHEHRNRSKMCLNRSKL